MIYATDDKGKIDPTFSPIIDGSLGSCDQLFRLLLSYLKALNVKDASKVLFIADGAKWIWNRVPALIKSLGLTSDQTQQRIDYWHAVEYLGKIVESSSLKGKQKAQWRKTQKSRLYRGDIGLVIIAIEQLIGKIKEPQSWVPFPGLTPEQTQAYAFMRPVYLASHNPESAGSKLLGPHVETCFGTPNAVYLGGYREGRKFGFGKMVN